MPALNKHDIVRAFAGEHLTIWFVGAFRGFRSGSAPRYKVAPHYRNMGIFTEFADGRLHCEGMEFTRHHSKISAILDKHGNLLYGQYCGKCKAPVPVSHGNCHRCGNEFRVPTAQTVAMVEARIAAMSSGAATPLALTRPDNVISLPASASSVTPSTVTADKALEQIAAQETNLRAILESDETGKDVLLASLLQEVIDIAKGAAPISAESPAKRAA